MDMQMNRDELLELVVHNGNSMEHDILSNIQIEDQNSSSDSDSQSRKEKDSDMDVDQEEEKLPIKTSKQEEKDRTRSFSYSNKDLSLILQSRYTGQERYHGRKVKLKEFLIIIKKNIENSYKTIEAEVSLL